MGGLLVLIGGGLTVCGGYFAMTEGWGLEMQSWGWFFGMYAVSVVGALLVSIGGSDK